MIDTRMSSDTYFSADANTADKPPAADKFHRGTFIDLQINNITLTVEKIFATIIKIK